jgi:hypothetical protein
MATAEPETRPLGIFWGSDWLLLLFLLTNGTPHLFPLLASPRGPSTESSFLQSSSAVSPRAGKRGVLDPGRLQCRTRDFSISGIHLPHPRHARRLCRDGREDRLRLHISSSASLRQAVMGLWLAQVTLIFGAIFHFPSPPSHPTLDTPQISGLCLSHPSWMRATQRTRRGSGGGCVYPVCASAGGTD